MNIAHHMAHGFPIFEISEGNGTLINGEIDDFIQFLIKINNNNSAKIALDLHKKTFLNSTGLGELVAVKDKLLEYGVELILLRTSEKVESLINMVGLDEFFHILSSEDELA